VLVGFAVALGVFGALAGLVFMGVIGFGGGWYVDSRQGWLGGQWWWVAVTAGAGVVVGFLRRLARLPGLVRPILGGVVFGAIGVALPLTMFTGSDQLKTALDDAGTMSVGLLIALVIAKQCTFAVSEASGFVGGPIFPALFIGGTAGILVHAVLPGVPLGLAFTCMLAAVPGSLMAAPFTMVLLAAFLTQVGALQTAPILIVVVTAFLVMEGMKYLVAQGKRAHGAAGERATPN
jgi:H+/Cl- antiporter ClcA